MKKFKNAVLLIILFLSIHFSGNACSPLNVPTMVGTPTVTATQLLIKWQSTTVYFCPDVIVVEIACNNKAYSGLAAYSFTSGVVTGNSNPYQYPVMAINISQLCPGTVYKFRAKEKNNSGTTASAWSGNFTFTTQGTFVQPTINVTAVPPVICPPQTSQLTANLVNGCGGTGITYQWTPATGLSCTTCSNPIASPSVTTTYTVVATGGQWGCWTASNTVQVQVTTVPPVVGVLSANPPVICAGQTTTLTSSSYTGNLQWQSSSNTNGPFANIAGATTGTYLPGVLNSNICYRALVAGCGATLTTNTICVTVNPSPTVTATSASICAGSTASFSANGAASYSWSAGAGSTGVNTATASPGTTTSYTVTGTTSGCTGTAVSTVTVFQYPVVNIGSNSPVCLGFNLNLTSTGGGTYNWTGPAGFSSTLQNPTVAGTSTANAGVYNLTVTANSCATSTNINVSIVTPTVNAGNDGPLYCAGQSIQLNATSAVSYTWTGPNGFTSSLQNPSISNSTPAASGTYTLNVTLGTCTAQATTTLQVNPTPTITINSASICAGNIATLTANGGTAYVWPSGVTVTGANTATTSPATTTSFTITGTSANGCTNTAVSTVTVYQYPVVNIGSNSPVCLGFDLNLTSTGGGSYNWTGPNSFASAVQNPTVAGTTLASGGVYDLTVTANGCSTTTNITVAIVNPTASASNSGPYCAGASVQLSASTAQSYTWAGPNGFTSNTQNPVIPNSTTAAGGTYTVVLTLGSCTAQATTPVTVNPLPVPVAGVNSPVCEAGILSLTGTGGTQYAWAGPSGFSSTIANPSINVVPASASGVYSLTVTDVNGCVSGTTINVVVLPLPVITIGGSTVCIGGTGSLTATGGVIYNWTGPNGFTSSAPSPTVLMLNQASAGVYSVVITGTNNCSINAQTSIGAYPIPMPSAYNSGPVCLGSSVSFSASGGFVYSWAGPNSFVAGTNTTSINSVSLEQGGTYTLSVIDDKGCQGSTTTYLQVRPLPIANMTSSANKSCVPFCATFSLSAASSSIASATWISSGGAPFPGLTYTNCYTVDGRYVLAANYTDVYGCSNTSTFEVNAYPIPKADFHIAQGKPVEESEVKFEDASIGPGINQWSWYFVSNSGGSSTLQNPSYYFNKPGSYPITLIISNKWGCKDTITKPVFINEDYNLYIPNAFTPNGDGINDLFFPKGKGILKYSMSIFDRWGELLFSTNEFTTGWDGTIKGALGKPDVYTYKIVVEHVLGKTQEYVGHVSLLR